MQLGPGLQIFLRSPVGGRIDPARPLAVAIDHAAYSHCAELLAEARKSIAADLQG
jgi:hypothetical protein